VADKAPLVLSRTTCLGVKLHLPLFEKKLRFELRSINKSVIGTLYPSNIGTADRTSRSIGCRLRIGSVVILFSNEKDYLDGLLFPAEQSRR